MWAHEAWVSSERDDERRRRDRTCDACGQESVHDGVCSNCQEVKQSQIAKISVGAQVRDKIGWCGKVYEGDGLESAEQKFRKEDRAGYIEWVRGGFER
jgi:hypothetical protein